MPGRVLAVWFQIQLPADAPGQAAAAGPSSLAPATHVEGQDSSWLLDFI